MTYRTLAYVGPLVLPRPWCRRSGLRALLSTRLFLSYTLTSTLHLDEVHIGQRLVYVGSYKPTHTHTVFAIMVRTLCPLLGALSPPGGCLHLFCAHPSHLLASIQVCCCIQPFNHPHSTIHLSLLSPPLLDSYSYSFSPSKSTTVPPLS